MAAGKFIFNPDSGQFEPHRETFSKKVAGASVTLLTGIAIFLLYIFLVEGALRVPSAKMALLESKNKTLTDRIEYISQRAILQQERLSELEMRDNRVYRPIFGMDELPAEVRAAGYTAPDRYASYDAFINSEFLAGTARQQDVIEMRTYLQSKSYDDIGKVAMRIEDMAGCIPSLFPVCPGPQVNITSPFGYRLHPIAGYVIFHSGTDIAGPRGTPVYASADGVVTDVKFNYHGYGNVVDIDHGFGYSTRYGHLQGATVEPGQKVRRGDQVGTLGSSGRATGPHLHYEVLYKTRQVNPWNYFDKNISPKTYMTLVTPSDKPEKPGKPEKGKKSGKTK